MNLIAAADQNWAIGKNNSLLISIPQDMRFFRETTSGKVVVMGRKTLESFPGGKPLKNRVNIVLTSNPDYSKEGVIVIHSPKELPEILQAFQKTRETRETQKTQEPQESQIPLTLQLTPQEVQQLQRTQKTPELQRTQETQEPQRTQETPELQKPQDPQILQKSLMSQGDISDDVFVIGGGSIYTLFLPLCDTAYITRIEKAFEADTYFPNLDQLDDWQIVEQSETFEYEGIRYSFVIYRRTS